LNYHEQIIFRKTVTSSKTGNKLQSMMEICSTWK